MAPSSNTSSPQSNQATAGSTNTTSSPQSHSTNDSIMRPDTTKDDYERNMAAYAKYYRRSAYGGLAAAKMATGGGGGGGGFGFGFGGFGGDDINSKASASSPSPLAPIFTPSTTGTNKAARAEAMRKFHIRSERKMRQVKKLEEELKEAVKKLDVIVVEKDNKKLQDGTGKVSKAKREVPLSLSASSVGSWTDDDEFIPYIKK